MQCTPSTSGKRREEPSVPRSEARLSHYLSLPHPLFGTPTFLDMAPACARRSFCAPFSSTSDPSESRDSISHEPPRDPELGTGTRSSLRGKLPPHLAFEHGSADGSHISLQNGQAPYRAVALSRSPSVTRIAELSSSTCISDTPGQYCYLISISATPPSLSTAVVTIPGLAVVFSVARHGSQSK